MRKVLPIILLIIGLFFLGRGITGMYILDFEQPSCSMETDCQGYNVCCNFYEEDYGICNFEDQCSAITEITREEKQRVSNLDIDEVDMGTALMSSLEGHLESPQPENKQDSIIIGVALLFFGLIVFYADKNKKA